MRKTNAYAPVRRGKRLLTVILWGCLIFALAVVIFLKAFELKHVTVTGGSRYTAGEIQDMLVTRTTDRVSLFFWLRMRFMGAPEIPFVEKVEINLTGRDSVEVTVYDKLVTGCVEQMGSYLYFDREGMVVESSRERLADVPLVTGLKFSRVVLREKMVVAKAGIFDVILDLARLIEKQELPVSQIAFDSDDAVTLYIGEHVVLLGKREHYDEVLAVLKSLLAAAEGRKLKIDMTAYENGNNRITAQSLEEENEPSTGDDAGEGSSAEPTVEPSVQQE